MILSEENSLRLLCLSAAIACSSALYAQTALEGSCLSYAARPNVPLHHKLVLVSQQQDAVLTVDNLASDGRSFEAGTVVFVDGKYRLFTTERNDNVNTRIVEWTSTDRHHWLRMPVIFESTGDRTGTDPRAALWAPMMVFDPDSNRWNMFYVSYFSKASTKERWYENYDGMVLQAVSQTQGREGIDGPYKDARNLLRPSFESQSWEGLQGTDSFYPYSVGKRWIAFYGSARTEKIPCAEWRVGLASAPSQSGPWTRCPDTNPVDMEKHFIENPIVYPVADGYIAVYDIDQDDPHSIGYAFSSDGMHWQPGQRLSVRPQSNYYVRTPLGLVPERDGTYTLFYTAFDKDFKPHTQVLRNTFQISSPLLCKYSSSPFMPPSGGWPRCG